jgi:hypothetical protein
MLALIALVCAPLVSEGATYTVVIAGLGGEPQYEARFREEAEAIASAARKTATADDQVLLLVGDEARRQNVQRQFQALAERMGEQDSVSIVLIGHGTFDGEEYRFNVPDLDLTGSELRRLFDALPARNQLIVNTTSASGAVSEHWQRPGRVLITATKSAGERTATRFARFWVQAVTSDVADLNKDQIVTAAEAFDYTSRQVAAAFKADVALATEHARMEGEQGKRFAVANLGPMPFIADPEVRALLAERSEIERDLEAVKQRKATMNEAQYYDELERVLVRLALLQRKIDSRQGRHPDTEGGG